MRDLNKFMGGALAEKLEQAMVEVGENILDPQLSGQRKTQNHSDHYV